MSNSALKYPTLERIDSAGRTRLGFWLRYLRSPGMGAIGSDNFDDVLNDEAARLELIRERFESLGGWSPLVSKAVDRLWESESHGPR